MDYLSRIGKRKKRHLLILSASGITRGLDVLFLEVQEHEWHIHHNHTVHYPSH